MEYRMEHDSMGDVRVPADRYWGAQTQRSFENFPIGQGREPMPPEIIHAFGILKKAAAIIHAAMFSVAAYTVILAFSLFKTGSLSKSIFNAH